MRDDLYGQEESFLDISSILERHKVPPDPDLLIVWDRELWRTIVKDAEQRGTSMKAIVREIVRSYYDNLSMECIPRSRTRRK